MLSKQVLSIEEASQVLGIGRSLAYELAHQGKLPVPVIRLGRRMLISRPALEEFLRTSAETVYPAPLRPTSDNGGIA